MNEFLALLLADRAAGVSRTAADYEERFPQLRGRIAGELAAIGAGEPAEALPEIPEVVIDGEIARGGQGIVYRGRQPYLDRVVAVKVLAPQVADATFAKRLRREARALASLTHANIVTCFQAGVTDTGQCYIVMEFVDGPTLRTWLGQHGAMPQRQVLGLARDLARALDHANAAGIVHRDVKPENVLLQPLAEPAADGFTFRPKLVDLGVARPLRFDTTATQATPIGMIVGTPQTMAPEQLDDPDSVDHRADVYGLGCVMYTALTGAAPFAGARVSDVFAAKAARLGPDPRQRDPAIATPIAELVRRMTAHAASHRPSTYDALIAELDGLLAPAPDERPAVPRPSSTRRRVLIAAPILLAAAAGGYWWGPKPRAAPALQEVRLFDAGDTPFASWRGDTDDGMLEDDHGPSLHSASGLVQVRRGLPRNAFVLNGNVVPLGRHAVPPQPVTRTGVRVEFGDEAAVVLELLPTSRGYRATWQHLSMGRPVGEPAAYEGTWSGEQPLRFRVQLSAGTLSGELDGGGPGRSVRCERLRGEPTLVLFVEGGMTSFPDFACRGS